MCSLYKTVLAVLLVASGTTAAPSDEECSKLVKPLTAPELSTISGSWILVHGYTDHPFYVERMKNTTSAQVDIVKSADNKTVTFKQGDMVSETCISYPMTLQVTDNTLQLIRSNNDTLTIDFFKTCPECLMKRYTSKGGVSLHLYGREGKVPEAELENTKKQVECLKFTKPQFTYDGVADFCLFQNAKLAAPSTEDCNDPMKPLTAPELNTIFGTWVRVEGYTDHPYYSERMQNTTSSQIEFIPSADNKTVLFKQAHRVNEKCIDMSRTMQVNDNTLQFVRQDNDTLTIDFFNTCPECLVVRLASKNGKSLHIYGRGGRVPGPEVLFTRKKAECLKFKEPQFSYDGVAELCPFQD